MSKEVAKFIVEDVDGVVRIKIENMSVGEVISSLSQVLMSVIDVRQDSESTTMSKQELYEKALKEFSSQYIRAIAIKSLMEKLGDTKMEELTKMLTEGLDELASKEDEEEPHVKMGGKA